MKTPREILLEQQQNSSPQLDEIRSRVIAQELGKDQPSILEAIRSWLSMNRIAWASFATAWVAIVGLNVATSVDGTSAPSTMLRADTEAVMKDVHRRQTQLAILLTDDEPNDLSDEVERTDSNGPRSDVTRPRRSAQLQNQFHV